MSHGDDTNQINFKQLAEIVKRHMGERAAGRHGGIVHQARESGAVERGIHFRRGAFDRVPIGDIEMEGREGVAQLLAQAIAVLRAARAAKHMKSLFYQMHRRTRADAG